MNLFRLYHLLFAAACAVAYFAAEEWGLVHAWTGYVVGALLSLRLLAGALRRRGFEFRRLIPRLGGGARGTSGLRHPAIAHGLTLALFASVVGVAGTGIAMDRGGTLVGQSIRAHDGEHRERGERAEKLVTLVPQARADDFEQRREHEGGEGEGDEGLLGEVHETLGNALLPLALAHIAYVLLFRFDLARFMLFVPRRRRKAAAA
ncbi:MAG: cytochrome b/b6 domain-containing protein [Sphingomonadales bacterium]|nr:cytochrome b/b6 domain-containing protein [Sphingomonadales bacterium]MBD3773217.1 cytochrome b/b6 domain-containing protein [Paracoccaceae bacterium]